MGTEASVNSLNKKRILVLGSTGSIGQQALEVVAESSDLEIVGMAGAVNDSLLKEQADDFNVRHLAMVEEEAGSRLAQSVPDSVIFSGPGCIKGLIEAVECDLVVNAVVGAAGLEATVATLEKGIDLALANKESLVVGGNLVTSLAAANGASILPIDSEHSAIFQCLHGNNHTELDKIYLTASGGPFWERTAQELGKVTIKDALNHPRWSMGSKISIDSATLMNKGLEIIEAHFLFDVPYNDIGVYIHPQSIVHSMIKFIDGSIIAQMGVPSMKLPIAYALNHPHRQPVTMPQLDLAAEQTLNFYQPDLDAFPCLRIARQAGERGGGAPIVVNAANEVAVAAFLSGRIAFLAISQIVDRTFMALEAALPRQLTELDDIAAIDSEAREAAESFIH